MLQRTVTAQDPSTHLARHHPDAPVHYFCPEVLRDRLMSFLSGFPGMVTFAVKANPSDHVISQLWAGGLQGFDVASPGEIEMINRLCPGAPMHYNNPVRSPAEIAMGVEAGVQSWSVDDGSELDKLIVGGVTGEVAVRFRLPVGGAHYDFGTKFGATEQEAEGLLARVAAAGLKPALTFHVGTQCADPDAYLTYMVAAARILRATGVAVDRLNIGGGFPSARDGKPVDLAPFFAAIRKGLEAFDAPPSLICEPGRGLVADAYAYAVQIKSLRPGRAYLNDGVYGGLSEFPSMVIPKFRVVGPDGTFRAPPGQDFAVFGPTCDSIDQLPGTLTLPAATQEGDWILFGSMGAYLNGVTTRFNGYGARETVTVRTGVAPV